MTKLVLIGLLTLVIAASGCLEPKQVSIEELFANPDEYNNQNICTTGFYADNFEISVLSKEENKNQAIWIEGQVNRNQLTCNGDPTNPGTLCQGPLTVCGLFEYKAEGGFGYFEAYKHRIILTKLI